VNFLLGTLLIILFLFPGFIFRASYLNVLHGRSFRSTFVEELLFSLVPSILIHVLVIVFTLLLTDFSVKGFYFLMINHEQASNWMTNWDILKLIAYCILTYILGYGFGFMFRRYVVERLNWDINIPIFRIRNEWYYILKGFLFQIQRRSGRTWQMFAEPDEIRVDALFEIGKESFIYRGKLENFVLSKEDGIDRLYLSEVTRRRLEHDENESESKKEEIKKKPQGDYIKREGDKLKLEIRSGGIPERPRSIIDPRYYTIPGNTFVLPFREIKNLNITYIFIE